VLEIKSRLVSRQGDTSWVVVGLDNGGTNNSATVLDSSGRFLVDELFESPSRVLEGPDVAIRALGESLERVLQHTGVSQDLVRAVGLGTPGPASADGVICSTGATNFSEPEWHRFDVRAALERYIGVPVVYNNDGNAAALYAHDSYFGDEATSRSSVSAIVGTGLGGGVIEAGRVIRGAAGMAGELGHIHIPMQGLLAEGQPIPKCNCGLGGDVESIASLTGIEKNLLPYWLDRFPDHDLHRAQSLAEAAKLVRGYGVAEDPLALEIFGQQAMALGRLFTIASNFVDPDAYFIGGGVVEASPKFREWFLQQVCQHTSLRVEQSETVAFALIPDLDMAGARGAALAAVQWLDTA
jgi:predicted NBD/HSP70 family sugar kinase